MPEVVGKHRDIIQLERRRYGVAISWDRARKDVDLDLQVVLVDTSGKIFDAVFHNNLSAAGGGVEHSGDAKVGSVDKYGELVWVDFSKLQLKVKMLIFVVAAHSGGHLVDVRKGLITVLEAKSQIVLRTYMMENSSGDVDAVVLMKRNTFGRWSVEPIDRWAEEGQSFLDLLDVISDLICTEIPSAPKRQEVNFIMDKNASTIETPCVQTATRTVQLDLCPYALTLLWDNYEPDGDVDCMTLVVDADGYVVEVASRLNVCCADGAIVRMDSDGGDGQERLRAGLTVQLDLKALDKQAKLLVFFLTTGLHQVLSDLVDVSLLLLDQHEDKSKARLNTKAEGLTGHSKVLVVFERTAPGHWVMVQRDDEGDEAGSLLDARAYIGGLVREYIPAAPPDDKMLRLQLAHGGATSIPRGRATTTLDLTLRWALAGQGEALELRAAVLTFDKQGNLMEATQASQLNTMALQIVLGSPKANEEEPNSQSFTLQVSDAAKSVSQVVLVANVGSGCLESIGSMSCSLTAATGVQLAIFSMKGFVTDKPGILLARLYRLRDRSWAFQAIGCLCDGHAWSDEECKNSTNNLVEKNLADLQPTVVPSEGSPMLITTQPEIQKVLLTPRASITNGGQSPDDDAAFTAAFTGVPLSMKPQLLLPSSGMPLPSRRHSLRQNRNRVSSGSIDQLS